MISAADALPHVSFTWMGNHSASGSATLTPASTSRILYTGGSADQDHPNNKEPARLGARNGAKFTLRHLQLWRDTFYTHQPESNVIDGAQTRYVEPGHFLCLGDNSSESSDSRYWGLVPRENIVGTPVIIYWSFEAPTADLTNGNIGIDHIVDVVAHFFTKTRWSRTFKLIKGYPLGRS